MRWRRWLESFIKTLNENKNELDYSTDTMWTQSIGLVMDEIGKKLHCGVSRIRLKTSNKEESEEYLNIDSMFFDIDDYNEAEYVLPRAIVEHHNDFSKEDIVYCLWKLLCVRSPFRILICYQAETNDIEVLRKRLEDVIWEGSLMKGTNSDLLVIIGDESKPEEAEWNEYYNIFEWRNDKLEKIEGLKW